jgi:hypothetical protein
MRKEIYEPWSRGESGDTECFKFGTSVNKENLAEGYIESFSGVLSEKEKRIRLEGDFFDLDGLALAHLFNRQLHLLPKFQWENQWPVVVAIDPHPQKAHVAVMVGCHPSGLVYIKELSMKLVPRMFARELRKFYEGYRVVDIVCDNLGSSEMTGGEGFKSFIEVLNDEGIRCRPTRYDEKVDADWIDRLQSVLALPAEPDGFGQCLPRLRIFEGNAGIIGDIETVQWARYRNAEELKPTLDIGAKDFLSALKYALACNLTLDRKKTKAFLPTKPLTSYGQSTSPARRQAMLKWAPKTRTRTLEKEDEEDW